MILLLDIMEFMMKSKKRSKAFLIAVLNLLLYIIKKKTMVATLLGVWLFRQKKPGNFEKKLGFCTTFHAK